MKTPPILRTLRPADADQCARLHAQAFNPSWPADDFRDQIARADRVLSGALIREAILVGFAASRFVGAEADLLTIVVDRAARRSGLGAKLLSHHLSALTMMRVKTVFLEVGATNDPALALYKTFGFVEAGKRKAYYGAGPRGREDALVLKCDL